MTRWIVYTPAQALDAYELAAAVDVELGYPRDEPVMRFHLGQHTPAGTRRTETHCAIVQLADGRVAVQVDGVVDALSGRTVDIDVGAGVHTVVIDTTAAQTFVELTDAVVLPPRGGVLK